jgi:hypothetical protein
MLLRERRVLLCNFNVTSPIRMTEASCSKDKASVNTPTPDIPQKVDRRFVLYMFI